MKNIVVLAIFCDAGQPTVIQSSMTEAEIEKRVLVFLREMRANRQNRKKKAKAK